MAAAQERRDPRVPLGGRPAAGGGPRRRDGRQSCNCADDAAPRRAESFKIVANALKMPSENHPGDSSPHIRVPIGGPGSWASTPQVPGRRLVPPYQGAELGAGFLGSCTFSKKEKIVFFFLKPYKNPRTRHQNRRPDMGGIVADRVLAGYSPKYPASTRQKLFFHVFFYVFADEAGLCCKFIGPAPQRGRATKRGLAMRATQRRARRRWGGAADQAQAALAVGGLANAGRRQSVSRPPGAREPAMRCPAKRRQVE